MSILSAELKKYGAASRPENDTSTSGGAIDLLCNLEITQLAANDTVRVRSSSASDGAGKTVTIHGRDAAGARVSEQLTLNGTTNVNGAQTFERILKITSSGTMVGTITVERSGGTGIATLAPGASPAASILFIDSSSESGSTVRYEKEFWKNENASLTLTNSTVKLTADPDTSIRVGCEANQNGSQSVTNRKTSPSVTFVDDGVAQTVPGTTPGNLPAGAAIGVWIEMTRGAGAAAIKSSYTTELAGTST